MGFGGFRILGLKGLRGFQVEVSSASGFGWGVLLEVQALLLIGHFAVVEYPGNYRSSDASLLVVSLCDQGMLSAEVGWALLV